MSRHQESPERSLAGRRLGRRGRDADLREPRPCTPPVRTQTRARSLLCRFGRDRRKDVLVQPEVGRLGDNAPAAARQGCRASSRRGAARVRRKEPGPEGMPWTSRAEPSRPTQNCRGLYSQPPGPTLADREAIHADERTGFAGKRFADRHRAGSRTDLRPPWRAVRPW